MATIKDKIDKHLNDIYIDSLHEYLLCLFPAVKFEKGFNIVEMRMVTTWDTKKPSLCKKIKETATAYEEGFLRARREIWKS